MRYRYFQASPLQALARRVLQHLSASRSITTAYDRSCRACAGAPRASGAAPRASRHAAAARAAVLDAGAVAGTAARARRRAIRALPSAGNGRAASAGRARAHPRHLAPPLARHELRRDAQKDQVSNSQNPTNCLKIGCFVNRR